MIDPTLGAIVGSLVGAAVSAVGEVSRAGIARALRETAEKVERGDLVSDIAIDTIAESFRGVREGLRKRGG